MKQRYRLMVGASSVLLLGACSGDSIDDEYSFRYAGDGDIAVYDAEDTDDPDLLVWDLVDVDAYDGPESGGVVLLTVDGNDIDDDMGTKQCELVTIGNPSQQTAELQNTSGGVIFTVKQTEVYDGRINLSSPPPAALRFTFDADHVYDGTTSGPILVTASEEIEDANTMRKSVLSALIAGECSAPGL